MADGTVYILDPDPDDRRTLEGHLANLGLDVHRCGTPSEVLERVETDQPTCLLCDTCLPEMTGLELQSILLRDHPEVAVVFATHDNKAAPAVTAMKQGGIDYFNKPVSRIVLVRAVHAAIGMASAWRRIQQERVAVHERARTLIERERQLLPYLAYGWSNKEITGELRVSIRTVEHYRRNVLKKMGVASAPTLFHKWVLMQISSPRCLEMCRDGFDCSRSLLTCPQFGCSNIASVLQRPPHPASQGPGTPPPPG